MGVRRHLEGVESGAPAGPLQGADLVVFDLDGTLVRLNVDSKSLRRKLGEIASRAGVRTTDPRALPLLDVVRGLGMREAARQMEALVTKHELAGARACEVNAPLVAQLRALPAWTTVGVLSLNGRQAVEQALGRCDVRDRVAACLGREDVARRKPHPDGLLELTTRFGTSPQRTVLVGDSRCDIECAERAGARAVHVSELVAVGGQAA